jgi:hypothetical protein
MIKMEVWIHRRQMSQFSAKENKGIIPELLTVVKSVIKLYLSFMVTDLVYIFQIIISRDLKLMSRNLMSVHITFLRQSLE